MPTKLKAPGMSSRASSRSKVGTLTNDDLDVIEGNRKEMPAAFSSVPATPRSAWNAS